MVGFLFPFSKFVANIFDSEHLGRFFKDQPLIGIKPNPHLHFFLRIQDVKIVYSGRSFPCVDFDHIVGGVGFSIFNTTLGWYVLTTVGCGNFGICQK